MAKLTSDRFAAVYNDLSAYPTIESVAEALGITVTQAKNRAAGIRGNRVNTPFVTPMIIHSPKTGKTTFRRRP